MRRRLHNDSNADGKDGIVVRKPAESFFGEDKLLLHCEWTTVEADLTYAASPRYCSGQIAAGETTHRCVGYEGKL